MTVPPSGMLLLHTAALPTIQRHDHPNLGRLLTPGCWSRASESLASGRPVAADNNCLRGIDLPAIAKMVRGLAPLPSVAARARRVYGDAWFSDSSSDTAAAAGVRFDYSLPEIPPNLLWVALPDVVRCRCGGDHPHVGALAGPKCAPVGDADATYEWFEAVHPWLSHLPLAFVLQDGADRPGRVPWGAVGLAAVFVAGSTAFKLSSGAAALVAEARRRGLHCHMGRVSTARRIRYAASIGCTSFDSTRYSMWRDLLLADGLARAAQPPQQRLIA